ncbi:hypothetical protein HBA55_35070 [Pseudomaricurvus alkylphenolicus]|uniref:hypothetical protein n=1 Tax=Pseudomaricurvus alkylphenolicus TaxID=1306991 RepID=UPI0014230737|nr:hypothetical protein [Pseudomaricurvus alkylphenolicus]NIB44856.1 hypothetical protein [Pseudomaricurvus alkylphenolicus]
MLKLITAQQWIREVFPEGGVGPRTVEKWIRTKVIHGRIIGGKLFVDPDRTAVLLESNTEIEADDATDPEPPEPTPQDDFQALLDKARAA